MMLLVQLIIQADITAARIGLDATSLRHYILRYSYKLLSFPKNRNILHKNYYLYPLTKTFLVFLAFLADESGSFRLEGSESIVILAYHRK